MKKAEVELVKFDSADVIATSGEIIPEPIVCPYESSRLKATKGRDGNWWYNFGSNYPYGLRQIANTDENGYFHYENGSKACVSEIHK